jgi:hypothetical protein
MKSVGARGGKSKPKPYGAFCFFGGKRYEDYEEGERVRKERGRE